MDKSEFVREAPIYYALAIAATLSRSQRGILKGDVINEFGDGSPVAELLFDDSLWDMAIDWLRQYGMVEVKRLPFGPPIYSQSEKFADAWYSLIGRGDKTNAFGIYGSISNADDWLRESLRHIHREAGELKLDPQDFARLSNMRPRTLSIWDEPDHKPVSDPSRFTEETSHEDAVQAIMEWFFTNFEDPVHNTPYNSREGGYLFIHGGPYYAREIIETVFNDVVPETAINEAIEQIESEGDSWVPNASRRIPPEDDSNEPPVEYLHGRMRRQVEELETLLKEEPPLTPGIGHNRPPEELELSPLKEEDKRELSEALDVLKNELPRPENPNAAQAAVATLKSKGKKLSEWTGSQAKLFVEEAIKEAGKQTGKWTPTVFWALVLEHVLNIAQHADAWIKAFLAATGH